jgi:hypothetical protein
MFLINRMNFDDTAPDLRPGRPRKNGDGLANRNWRRN